jgi:hypothetical protein
MCGISESQSILSETKARGEVDSQSQFVVDIQAEDGTVATWAAYDACVALKLIGPTTRPPEPPPRDRHWKKKLKPWPGFSRRRRSKRVRR